MAFTRPDTEDLLTMVELLQRRSSEGGPLSFRFLGGRDDREEHLSSATLDLRARALGAYLQDRGLSGERALLCYPPGVEFLVGLFGSFYAGMVAVPAYPPRTRKKDARLSSIANSCRPAVVLGPSDLVAGADDFAEHNPALAGIGWLASDSVPDSFAERWQMPRIQSEDLAVLQYTSGSTGDPKGVMLSHRNILHNVGCIAEWMNLPRGIIGVSWLPAFHDMGLIGNLIGMMYFAGPQTLLSPLAMMQDPFRWLETVSQTQAYISGGPCFAYELCIKRITPEQRQQLDLSHWKVAYTGAEPISARVMDDFARTFAECGFQPTSLYPCYGLAESTLMVTGAEFGIGARVVPFAASALASGRAEVSPEGKGMVSCGRPAPGLDVRVVDAETRGPVSPGTIGEVWVSGPSVAMGYFERAEATEETFGGTLADGSPARYLRTGDLGFFHEGELFIAGRLKDVLIIRGRNYYPQDIEEAALSVSALLRPAGSAAFTLQEGDAVRLVLVAEVQRAFKPGQGGDVFDAVRAKIAEEFGIELSELVLVRTGSRPRTSSGKVARRETRQRYLEAALEVVEHLSLEIDKETRRQGDKELSSSLSPCLPVSLSELEGEVRDWLLQRLAQQIGRSPRQIDPERPFASYGLDSVAMVSIAADLERHLGRRLSPTLLYSAPTINGLARLLSEGEKRVDVVVTPTEDRRVAIIGIGCRLPGADGVPAFWQLLREGSFTIQELPEGRRADGRAGAPAMPPAGYLDDVRHFDASFFAITQREASCIDPQHRILLEVAYHALEDAALAVDRLAGSRTGVFVGISSNDYARLLFSHAGPDAYLSIGNAGSMAAHRLSYHLDLRGPSLAIDSACSSALSAVHMACQSLHAGDCDMALAGGVNLILAPDVTASLTRAQMLSPDGRCKTFDASADGYVRGEGCGMVVLKPLAAALRDGDPIHAVLEATATNQDGRSNGITAPNGPSQTALIRHALAQAGRTADEVGCIEAHGTGTPLGDPIEFDALTEAIGTAKSLCALSAVKTNIGHLEAAAGIAGLIKATLQIEHGQFAPHLHLDTLNPLIRMDGSRFFVPKTLSDWPAEQPRVAGVSSFGFGGTNVHAVVAAAPQSSPVTASMQSRFLVPVSGRSEQALRDQARALADHLRGNPDLRIADISRTLGVGRTHLSHRLVVQATTTSELAEHLETFVRSGRSPATQVGKTFEEGARRVALLFTGQGAAYPGMARRLDETEPVFRAALNRCEQILRSCSGYTIREGLSDPTLVDQTDFAQPAMFAFGYALAELWRSWGIVPAGMLGHSVGEFIAAAQAGVFSLEDGLALIAARGRLMQACPAGAMLACLAAVEQVQPTLDRWTKRISLAADNGPRQCVLAGDADAIATIAKELGEQGIDSRLLRVGRAFHSTLIEPALDELREVAAKITYHAPNVPLASNVTGDFFTTAPSADYWVEHARRPVRFEAGVRALQRLGVTHFVEVGPAAVLTRLGAQCLPGAGVAWVASQRGESDDGSELYRAVGRLHVDGVSLAWDRIAAEGQRISLPGYAFQRRPFWVTDLPRWEAFVAVAPTAVVDAVVSHSETFVMRSCWRQAIERRPAGFDRDLAGVVDGIIDEVWREHPLEGAVGLRTDFDRLAGLYVASALAQLGWRPRRREAVELTTLAQRLNLPPRQQRLLGRMLGLAAEDGWLTWDGTRGEVVSLPPAEEPGPVQAALMHKYPDFDVELRLADHCARHLAAVLSGEVDPLHVLFGSEAGTLTEDIYGRSPVARFYNTLLTRAIDRLLVSLPSDRPIRILELGAGTGGTTQALLPILPADRCEYVFSDVSSLFLAKAREKFAAYEWIDHRVLDLEQDLDAQGFADGQFDLILAANVLHATADLRQSVRHARRLLAPGGLLVLLEGTGPRRLLDLIFGLTEGWWRFRDTDLRPDYPLISPAAWKQLLHEEGFAGTLALPEDDARLPDPDQVVLLAWAGAEAHLPVKRRAARPNGWVVCGDESPLIDEMVLRLQAEGQSVAVVSPEMLQSLRSHLNGSTPKRAIFMPGSILPPGAGSFENRWLVSVGEGDLSSAWGHDLADNEHRIDLDPSQPATMQAATLVEALLRPDEATVVIYRDDQRFVAPKAIQKISADTPAAEEGPAIAAPDRATLLAASPFERRTLVDRYLRLELARLLGNALSDEDMEMPVQSLGLDSLMAIQVRNRVEASLGVSLSLVDFLKGLRVRQLVDNILKLLPEKNEAPARPVTRPVVRSEEPVHVVASEVRSLSESELDSLLVSLLEK